MLYYIGILEHISPSIVCKVLVPWHPLTVKLHFALQCNRSEIEQVECVQIVCNVVCWPYCTHYCILWRIELHESSLHISCSVGYHLSIRDSNSYFENFYFTGSYCWRRIGCGDVQQGHAAPSLQHQDKEHGRCLEQILGWNLPVVYICDKARGSIVFAKEVECRRWHHPVNNLQAQSLGGLYLKSVLYLEWVAELSLGVAVHHLFVMASAFLAINCGKIIQTSDFFDLV